MIPQAVMVATLSLVSWSAGKVFPGFTDSQVVKDGLSPEEYEELKQERCTFPGTKWCGPGNTAQHPDDLGTAVEADRCCRDHDHCPDVIPGWTWSAKHNLTNEAFHTRLNCSCDDRFLACLYKANTTTASLVGEFYFDIIGQKCFRVDYPAWCVMKRPGMIFNKCVQYEYDTTGDKLHQWFDVPFY